MQIGNTTIVTPRDNPLQYDPDWRNSIATALVDFPDYRWEPLYSGYRDDKCCYRHWLSAVCHLTENFYT